MSPSKSGLKRKYLTPCISPHLLETLHIFETFKPTTPKRFNTTTEFFDVNREPLECRNEDDQDRCNVTVIILSKTVECWSFNWVRWFALQYECALNSSLLRTRTSMSIYTMVTILSRIWTSIANRIAKFTDHQTAVLQCNGDNLVQNCCSLIASADMQYSLQEAYKYAQSAVSCFTALWHILTA